MSVCLCPPDSLCAGRSGTPCRLRRAPVAARVAGTGAGGRAMPLCCPVGRRRWPVAGVRLSVSVCLPYLSVYQSINQSIMQSTIYLTYLSICLSIYLSINQSVYLSIYPSIYLSNLSNLSNLSSLSIYLSICLSLYLSIYLI